MDTCERSAVVSDRESNELEDLIPTLSRAWDVMFRKPLYKYNDFWFHPYHLRGTLQAQHRFVAQPEDIVVCSFPKTGTTWLKALAFATATRSQFNVESATHPLSTNTPHECVPFLELNLQKILTSREKFRVLGTHIPHRLLPDSVRNSTCKIVYVWRDPKDAFISLLYFLSGVEWGTELDTIAIPLEEAFDQFCQGLFTAGPYWDHVVEYSRASKERPDKVLCLRYEDLMKETPDCVRRLAEFIAQPFSREEEERGTVDQIVKLCSFENLRSSEGTSKGGLRSEDGEVAVRNTLFYRRGKVGDWKNHLSDEMAARLDNIFQENLTEAGLTFPA